MIDVKKLQNNMYYTLKQNLNTELYIKLISFLESEPRFFESPAARSKHSAYPGGLLRHTAGVVALCDAVVLFHEKKDELDLEILFLAAVLHDFGKIYCYDKCSKKDGKEYNYSETGKLLGHIFRSAEVAERNFSINKDERKSHLVHCILAHHGRLEWGSPIVPKTKEAKILHCCDYTEAHIHLDDAKDSKKLFDLERGQ